MPLLSHQIAGFFDHHYLEEDILIYIFVFLDGDSHQRKTASESLVCLSLNQIAGFFNQQYTWKELIDILAFVHGDIH